MPRAGLEPNWGDEKPSSGRLVTPHRLVLTRVFLPPCPRPYRGFRAKAALEGNKKLPSLDNHLKDLVSVDFFVVPTVSFKILFVFIVLAHTRRRVVRFNATGHPTATHSR